MFADDVQLYLSFEKPVVNAAVFRMNQDLHAVNEWARANFLSLNARKSQAIVFSENGTLPTDTVFLPWVLLGGSVIPYADKVLNLGMLMDKRMVFKDQVDQICARVFSRLRSLWPLSQMFPLKTRLLLVRLLVIPAFTYGECVYSTNLSAVDERSLERAFSACIRFAYRLRRYDSTRCYVDKLLGAPILTFLKQRRCSALHALVVNKEPSYLFGKLTRGNSSRSGVFVVPRHCTAQYNDSFFVSTLRDYNSLPLCMRKLNSATKFSRDCLDHLHARPPT